MFMQYMCLACALQTTIAWRDIVGAEGLVHGYERECVTSGSRERRNEAQTPLTPAMFHVLLALAGGEMHGYAILKEVAERTGGKVKLSAGTLYGIIKRLLDSGWIAEISERPGAAFDDERRRYYRLTDEGRGVAMAETARLEEMVEMARAKQLGRKPGMA
jgi:DNA-binding PadR family transcriptional regulator